MSTDCSVVAIVAAYNEADIVEQVVRALTEADIQVYFLDDGSTDGTVEKVEPFLGRGVLAIERRPVVAPDGGGFEWERILRRKAALALEIEADWLIHHDADEFRESPWPDLNLKAAIGRVDALGYNAIDFESLDFWPTHDRFRPGDDVRQAFPFYSRRAPHDRVQIRCWKKAGLVDLATSGGHEAEFPDRRVFPIRFILRHYPIRGQAHGERKIFAERRNRYLEAERSRGWHIQYDAITPGASFMREDSTLTRYDPDRIRLELLLRHRGVEDAERATESARRELASTAAESRVRADELAVKTAEIDRLHGVVQRKDADIERWRAAVHDLSGRLDAFQRSLSWRCTEPLRTVFRLFKGGDR